MLGSVVWLLDITASIAFYGMVGHGLTGYIQNELENEKWEIEVIETGDYFE